MALEQGETSRASFNSRAHEGRDCLPLRGEAIIMGSIHAPTRGATLVLGAEEVLVARFNSRAHEGRDPSRPRICRTAASFQFTRPRGARLFRIWFLDYACCFNSRAHEGRDLQWLYASELGIVSIHAPTRGATPSASTPPGSVSFQFTRPRGARPLIFYHILSLDRKGDFREPWPFSGLFSLIVNDQVFCARRERPILPPRTS